MKVNKISKNDLVEGEEELLGIVREYESNEELYETVKEIEREKEEEVKWMLGV